MHTYIIMYVYIYICYNYIYCNISPSFLHVVSVFSCFSLSLSAHNTHMFHKNETPPLHLKPNPCSSCTTETRVCFGVAGAFVAAGATVGCDANPTPVQLQMFSCVEVSSAQPRKRYSRLDYM